MATEFKFIIVMRDGVTMEKAKCSDVGLVSGAVVHGFKITSDSLIIAIDHFIDVYFKSGGNYLSK